MKTSDILLTLNKDQLTPLLMKSDLRALIILGFNYLLIASCFLTVIHFSHIFTWIFAATILAGRQLGLAILMHDCAHQAFFRSPAFNKFFGRWICAAPVLADLDRYRTYHLEHHRTAGSQADPDRSNYVGYPVSAQSLIRKFTRDLLGITGLKIFATVIKMNAGTVAYQLAYDLNKTTTTIPLTTQVKNLWLGLYPSLIFHSLLFILLYSSGNSIVYLLWWFAWFTFYMAFSRLRNAAEHGATLDINDLNPIKNTRTTLASWWERLLVAPNYVNYHLEHHLLPTIPSYHLPQFHQLLKSHDLLKDTKIASGYIEVIKDLNA